MLEFEMNFLGEFAYDCDIGSLGGWEQESLGVLVEHF